MSIVIIWKALSGKTKLRKKRCFKSPPSKLVETTVVTYSSSTKSTSPFLRGDKYSVSNGRMLFQVSADHARHVPAVSSPLARQ